MKIALITPICILFQLTLVKGQSGITINVFPQWKKGDIHHLKITSNTKDTTSQKISEYTSVFYVGFVVAAADAQGSTIEWTYTRSSLAKDDILVENQVLSRLINTKFICKLSSTGVFRELINAKAVTTAANKVLDSLILKSAANKQLNAMYKETKQRMASVQGMDNILLKHIKFYCLSFGYGYSPHAPQTNALKMTNVFGGQPFDAVEKIELTQLDSVKAIGVIERQKNVNPVILKTALDKYVKELKAQKDLQVSGNVDASKLEFSEKSTQQIRLDKGLVQQADMTRVIRIGIQNRVNTLEITAID